MIEQVLVDRLRAGLAGVGVDWGLTPQGFLPPSVVATLIDDLPDYEFGAAVSDLRAARVQLDCYAVGVDAVVALAAQVQALLSGWIDRPNGVLGCFVLAVRDLGSEAAGVDVLTRRSIDIRLIHKEV